MHTLLAYASKYGATRENTTLLAEMLDGEVDIVDLKETKEEYSDSTFDHLKNKKKDVDERSDDFKK